MRTIIYTLLAMLWTCQIPAFAQVADEPELLMEAIIKTKEKPQAPINQTDDIDLDLPPADRVLVILPEKVDVEWFWYAYTADNELQVQTAVEKQLLREGLDVVDITEAEQFNRPMTLEQVQDRQTALTLARELNANYLVLGQAIAVNASRSQAYGVSVYRSNANLSARVMRVSDGKVINIIDMDATEGAQSQRVAARNALKNIGKQAGRKARALISRDMIQQSGS